MTVTKAAAPHKATHPPKDAIALLKADHELVAHAARFGRESS